jgi:UPF0042 nucleotide-binding protein
VTVAIGCTGGQHRSVFVAESLTSSFRASHGDVQIRHRELKHIKQESADSDTENESKA